jgi:hypothetical protein
MKDLLSELKSGDYAFKEPWRVTDKSLTVVVPIVSSKAGQRNYVVLEEVKDKVKIIDTGGISQLRIEGNVDESVFIRGGTMLKGSTQERATQFGFVVVPSKEAIIPVHCIHASRGIRPRAEMQSNGAAPMKVVSSMIAGRRQADTWSAVENYSCELFAVASPLAHAGRDSLPGSDDLAKTVDALNIFRKDLQDALKRIPDDINQVGVVMIDPDGVVGLEVYDHPDSWKTFSQSIIRSFSDNLAKEDKSGLFKPDMSVAEVVIKEFLETIEGFQEETVFSRDNAETVVLRGKGYVGEYTRLKDKTIHLLITRFAENHSVSRYPYSHEPNRAYLTGAELGSLRNYFESEQILRSRIQEDRVASCFEDASEVSKSAPVFSGIPEQQQARKSAISRFFNWGKRKTSKGKEVLSAMKEEPKTWTDLKNKLRMSKATLSNRLTEFQERGAVEKFESENGKTRYGLTGIGQELLRENGKLGNKKLSSPPTLAATQGEECPKCHSNNVILRGDGRYVTGTCIDCKHEWTKQ